MKNWIFLLGLLSAWQAQSQNLVVETRSRVSSEKGAAAWIQVKLDAAPSAEVTYTLSFSQDGELEADPLVVSVDEAQTFQPIRIKGLDDDERDGDVKVGVTLAATGGASDTQDLGEFVNRDDEGSEANSPPSRPWLRSPSPEAEVSTTAELSWELPFDQDGDDLRFQVCLAQDEEFADAHCFEVDEEGQSLAQLPWLFVLALLGLCAVPRRLRPLGLLLLLPLGCGERPLKEAFKLKARPAVSAEVPAGLLMANKTYHWRVDADDQAGNLVSSDVRSLRTEAP